MYTIYKQNWKQYNINVHIIGKDNYTLWTKNKNNSLATV